MHSPSLPLGPNGGGRNESDRPLGTYNWRSVRHRKDIGGRSRVLAPATKLIIPFLIGRSFNLSSLAQDAVSDLPW